MARRNDTRTRSLIVCLAVIAGASGGCVHRVVITNTTDRDIVMRQRVEGGERSLTIQPGAEASFPTNTQLQVQGITIEYR